MALQERTGNEQGRRPGAVVEAGPLVDRVMQFRSAMMRMAQELTELRRENRLLRMENEALRGRFRRDDQPL